MLGRQREYCLCCPVAWICRSEWPTITDMNSKSMVFITVRNASAKPGPSTSKTWRYWRTTRMAKCRSNVYQKSSTCKWRLQWKRHTLDYQRSGFPWLPWAPIGTSMQTRTLTLLAEATPWYLISAAPFTRPLDEPWVAASEIWEILGATHLSRQLCVDALPYHESEPHIDYCFHNHSVHSFSAKVHSHSQAYSWMCYWARLPTSRSQIGAARHKSNAGTLSY